MVYAGGWEEVLGYRDDEIGLLDIVNSTTAEFAPFANELKEKALMFIQRKTAELEKYSFTIVLPTLRGVLHKAETSILEDQLLVIERNGYRTNGYFTFSCSAIRDETGNTGGVFCAVTETIKTVLPDKHPSKQISNLFKDAPVAIMILNGNDYTVEVANDSYLQIVEKEKDFIGKPIFESLPELESQGFRQLLDNVILTGTPYYGKELEVQIMRNTKKIQGFYNFIYQPIREEDHSINGIIVVATEVTDQVLSRNKIEETNKRYYKMLMDSPFAFSVMKGKDMVVTLANDLMKEFWGKGMNVEGKALLEILPELTNQPFPESINKVYTSGIPVYLNEILAQLKHDGKMEDHYFNIVYQPHYEADETISGVTTIAYEVTELVLSRKKLEVQAALFGEMLMTAPGLICTLSGPEHTYELVNKKYQSLFGKRQIQGKPIMIALPELEGQGFDKLLDNVYNTGETYVGIDIPITLARDENVAPEVCYFNFSYQPMFDENKNIYSILVFGYEVTEQMVAKKRMEESELHFRKMADLMPAKITNADAAGGVTYYNKHWMDYTGCSFEDFKDFGYHNIMHPDELDEYQRLFQQAATTGTDLEMKMRIRNKAGEYKWHLNLATPVKDDHGNIKMWIGVTTEIQKIKDEEILKDNFISMAGHELKTPVTTIKAYGQIAEMMLQKKGDMESLGIIKRISTQITKTHKLIEELLDFTQIRKGKLLFKEAFFDFNEFVKDVVADMQSTSATHIIENLEGETAPVYGDKEKLSQVVNNLISNAIKYSPGADKIIVSTKQQEDGMEMYIQDFGIGISEAAHQQVFEQFYRVTGDSQSKFPGMGIGLYISSEIIKRQGGKIWVKKENT